MKTPPIERNVVATITPPRAVIGSPQRPYRRGVDNAILGGVCGGLAIRLGVKEQNVRVVFSLLALVAGIGLLLYVVLWLCLDRGGEDRSILQRLLGPRRELPHVLLGLVAVVATIVVLHAIGTPDLGVFTWPLLLSALAVAGIWRGSSDAERQHLSELVRSAPLIGVPASRSTRSLWLRVALGLILVYVGLHSLRRFGGFWGVAVPALFGSVILIAGVLILLAPWWLATINDLSGERRERVLVEERANVAAHLHDSVLQTLTLIERAAGDQAAVTRLARNQERELRSWLFSPHADPTETPATFVALLRALEDEIENDYGVKVEMVLVGDAPASDAVVATVAAGREAAINAARWSGASTVSIYGEVESSLITLFVRDRGCGFVVENVADDRRGIALSIRQRMEGLGGTSSVKSTLNEGTEVALSLPRDTK